MFWSNDDDVRTTEDEGALKKSTKRALLAPFDGNKTGFDRDIRECNAWNCQERGL
eukprot:m.143846 g.143846  ORF g.143846 m.143846 type:complete len:55 (-) comp24227_c0_seq3:75-239(-)